MLGTDERAEVHRVAKTTMIIVLALIGGVVVFAAIAAYLAPHPPASPQLLHHLALGVAGVSVVLAWVVPVLVFGAVRRKIAAGSWSAEFGAPTVQTEAGKLALAGLTRAIIGCAFLEGAALINVVVHLLSGRAIHLIVACAFVLAMFAWLRFPPTVETWVEGQLQRVRDERG
ncbi:MAG: hypothetical protein ACYTG6_14045 [Planctomycetota bacterium]